MRILPRNFTKNIRSSKIGNKVFTKERSNLFKDSLETELLTFVYGIQKIQIHVCFSQFEKGKKFTKISPYSWSTRYILNFFSSFHFKTTFPRASLFSPHIRVVCIADRPSIDESTYVYAYVEEPCAGITVADPRESRCRCISSGCTVYNL